MKSLIALALFVLASPPMILHKDRVEPLRTLTVGFGTGETATFSFSGTRITAIRLLAGKVEYAVPEAECAKLREARFETTALIWNGSHKSAETSNDLSLEFRMGPDSAMTFGELPLVQPSFLDGKFEKASVTKKTGERRWKVSDL